MFQILGTRFNGSDRRSTCNNVFRFLCLIFITSVITAPAFSQIIEFPQEPSKLFELLADGTIDSVQYEMLFSMYAVPLSVPRGEYTLLCDLFPDLNGLLPETSMLTEYCPWDNLDIQRFLADYPALQPFRPILDFGGVALKENGAVAVTLNRSRWDQLQGQHIRFHLNGAVLKSTGLVQLSDRGASWQRRTVEYNSHKVNVKLGTFPQPSPGRLFWGRFSDGESADSSNMSNWIYGVQGLWNGISAKYRKSAIEGNMYYHFSPGESRWGSGLKFVPSKQVSFFCGYSNVWARDSLCRQDVLQCCTEVKTSNLKAFIESGFLIGQELRMPVAARIKYGLDRSWLEYDVIFFPEDLILPLSGTWEQLSGEVAANRVISRQMLLQKIRASMPVGSKLFWVPEMRFFQSGSITEQVESSVQLRWSESTIQSSFKQAYTTFPLTDSVQLASKGTFSCKFSNPLAADMSCLWNYGTSQSTWLYSFELHYSGLPGLQITPFLRGSSFSEKDQVKVGISNELLLYKRTWTRLTLESSLDLKGWENVYLKGSSAFLF